MLNISSGLIVYLVTIELSSSNQGVMLAFVRACFLFSSNREGRLKEKISSFKTYS